MADKVDLKRVLPTYRAQAGSFQVATVPPMSYLMLDGCGDPNVAADYRLALATLYPVAYALKFHSKRALGRDYVIPPLEALWRAEDMTVFTSARDKTQWSWTVMLHTPAWLQAHDVAHAVEVVRAKGSAALLSALHWDTLDEGTCVQTLHVGSYDDEGSVLSEMHEIFIPNNGFSLAGQHHEIYLSDPRRVQQDKLRTILRQPVERIDIARVRVAP